MNTRQTDHRETVPPSFLEWLRRFNKRVTNRLTIRFAGKHVYALLHHQGRKSGREYLTPVAAVPAPGGFIIPLPYGEHTDWCQNILATGQCRMEWRGGAYTLCEPRLVQPEQAVQAFPGWLQPLLRHTKIYLRMDQQGTAELPDGRKIRTVLVYGAGVLGSLYAGKLQQAGYDVTLLARGHRLEELRERGLALVEDGSSQQQNIQVKLTDRLAPEDEYDLVMVVVRKNQLPGVLPPLAANTHTPNVLFLVNNAEGPGPLVSALGPERVLLGFPGAGGQREAGVVRYRLASSVQPTTIGELNGQPSARLAQIALALKDAGLPVAQSNNMDAWLKTHVALVSPIANALYLAGGSNYRLARTRDGLVLMVRAVKEGLRVLRALRIPITPSKYQVLLWLPETLLVYVLSKRMMSQQVELVMARHANAARDEMSTLAEEFRVLTRLSGLATPAIDALYCFTDPANPPIPEGQARIKMSWGPTIAAAGAVTSAALLGLYLLWKRSSAKGRK